MYIRKSVLNGLIILTGLCILIAMAFIFCFTETQIPPAVFCAAWITCLLSVSSLVGKNCRN